MGRFLTLVYSRPLLLTAAYVFCIYLLTLYPFSFNPANNLDFLSDGGVHFSRPSTMYTKSFPHSLSQANKFTLLIHFRADFDHSLVNSSIITNSVNSYEQNFFVRQFGSSLQFRAYTGNPPEQCNIYMEDVVSNRKNIWCAIVHDGEKLYAYINGSKKIEIRTGAIDCSTWNRSYPLVMGSEANGYWNWEGILFTAAFFDEALNAASLQNPDSLIQTITPVLLFQLDGKENGYIRSRGKDTLTVLNVPERFIPFQRTFLMESTTQFWKRRIYFRDVFLNIALFLPFGFLIGTWLAKKNAGLIRITLLTLSAGFFLSLSIESLQVFLPERISSISDILSNSVGAVIGGVLYFVLNLKLKK